MRPTCSQYDALELSDIRPAASYVDLTLTVEEPSAARALRLVVTFDLVERDLWNVEVVAVCSEAGEVALIDGKLSLRLARWLNEQDISSVFERATKAHSEHWADYRAYGAA